MRFCPPPLEGSSKQIETTPGDDVAERRLLHGSVISCLVSVSHSAVESVLLFPNVVSELAVGFGC